jgi:hypothetical protein
MSARIVCSTAAAVMIVLGCTACGGSGGGGASAVTDEPAAVRVGERRISSSTVAHWMAVMAPQHVVPMPPRYDACVRRLQSTAKGSTVEALRNECRADFEQLKTRAIGFLISSYWLIEEAAREGMAVSEREVAGRVAEKRRSYASAADFQESLAAIDYTRADLRLEVEAQLARGHIERRLAEREPKVTARDIASYYRRHIARYHIPEGRYFNIGENFPSPAAARREMKAVAAGGESILESLSRKPFSDYKGEKRTIVEAIFKAKLRVVTQPIRLNNLYFLIYVTRITPAYLQSVAQVRGAIYRKLSTQRRRQTVAAFIAAWRSRWIPRTDCDRSYVVQKCRQYSGPIAPEEPLSFS